MNTLILALLIAQGQNPSEADAKKAEKVLSEKPDDPAANLVLGKRHLTFGDLEKALPFLLKGSDASLKTAAKAEGEAAGKNALFALEAGDLWTQAMAKNMKLRQPCLDRASYWYAKAWPDLDVIYKAQLRERLSRLYTPVVPGRSKGDLPQGWGGPVDAKSKAMLQSAKVHSGGCAMKLSPPGTGTASVFRSPVFAVAGGKKLEVSAWILTDGTDHLAEGFGVHLLEANGKLITSMVFHSQPDTPVWVLLKQEIVAPDQATKASIDFVLGSVKGTFYVDDVSVKSDGKEVLKGGSFEP